MFWYSLERSGLVMGRVGRLYALTSLNKTSVIKKARKTKNEETRHGRK